MEEETVSLPSSDEEPEDVELTGSDDDEAPYFGGAVERR